MALETGVFQGEVGTSQVQVSAHLRQYFLNFAAN